MNTAIVKYNQLSDYHHACFLSYGGAPEAALASITFVATAVENDTPIVFVKFVHVEEALLITQYVVSPTIAPKVASEAGNCIDGEIEKYSCLKGPPIKRVLIDFKGYCRELRSRPIPTSSMGSDLLHQAIPNIN